MTPLVKVFTGLEVLLGDFFDWEGNLLTKNGQLVSRWRQMEPENYKVIFNIKKREFEAKAYQWWSISMKLYALMLTMKMKK
jgi:hypothetical protein